jgi:acyl-CoA reductase-like NAD-dependent aldehyde dehydrogenase
MANLLDGKLFIANEFVASSSGSTFTIVNPSKPSESVSHVSSASLDDVESAVKAAEAISSQWQNTLGPIRVQLLLKLAGLLMQYEEEINNAEARSMGKPPGTLPSGTYAGLVTYYAGAVDKVQYATRFNISGCD